MLSLRCLSALFGLTLVFSVGCAGLPTNPLSLSAEGQQLLDTTRDLREAVSGPQPLSRELNKGLHPPYEVEPGDVLLVQPAQFDSPLRLPGDQPVLSDGTINLGAHGRLIVAGKTVEAIEAEVGALLQKQVANAGPITVRVVSRQSKVFYVLGEVNAPGAYPLSGRETVLDALMTAGGVNSQANLRGITLSRPTAPTACRIVLPVCYQEIVQLGDTSTNYQIMNGDRIFVPASSFWDSLPGFGKKCHGCGGPHLPCLSEQGVECSSFRQTKEPPAHSP